MLATSHHSIYISIKIYMETPESFLPLKPNWFHVLLALADADRHGYAIMQEVLEHTGGKVRLWPATLYGTLQRLIEAELIAESDARPAPDLDDARRRYYRITPLGAQVLAAESARLEDLVRALRAKRPLLAEEAES